MAETETLYDAQGNPVEVERPESPNVKQMRARIAELEAAEARATDLEAQLLARDKTFALHSAGIVLDETKQKALEAVHVGDWTADSVRATAVQLGWATAPPPQTPQAEIDALNRMNAAHTGGTTTPPDPELVLDSKLGAAQSEKEFMEIYLASGRPIAP